MDTFMYDGALLDDSQLRSRHDPDEDLNNETFGDGFGDGGDWEENHHQQQAEFERLRQQDLGILSQNSDQFSAPAQNTSNGADCAGETDFFGRPVTMQAPTRLDKELIAPAYFQSDDGSQPHDISRDLDRLLSEDDGATTGDTDDREDVRWMNGAPGGAYGQPQWTGGMQHIPLRAMGGDVPSAASAMGRLDLRQPGRPAMGHDQLATRAAATEASVSPAHPPPRGGNHHAAAASPGGLSLAMLLGGAGAAPGAAAGRPLASVKGGRLEDIESTLQTCGGPSPSHAHAHRGDGHPGADPARRTRVDHMQQLLHSPQGAAVNRASTPPDGGGPPRPGMDAMPLRAPPMMPPPRPGGVPRPPPGTSPSGPPRSDGRPGFPPMLPPNMQPPMHPSFRGMQPPPPWFMGGMPPAGGQRMPDMGMMRYPMPPGMRPPGLDPSWRGPPPPNYRPMMPMGPPPPGSHSSMQPPQMSSPVGNRQRQLPQRNVMDYPFVFMTNKEKDWIRKVQLIQLSKFSSWMDDYYYLKYRQRHPSARPMLGIPKLDDDFEIKPESPHGRVTLFEGALGGRISTGSVHCPRQTLMIDGPINISCATSPREMLVSKMHRSRQLLSTIERAYVQLLQLEDDQPLCNVSAEDRRAAVSRVFRAARVRPLPERLRDLKDVEPDEHAVGFVSVAKGARLVARVLPKLSMPEAQSLAGLLCHHLLPVMDRDEEKVSVRALMRGLQGEFQRWSLGVLVRLLDMLNAQTLAGVAAVVLLVERYAAAAVAFLDALVLSGYEQCVASTSAAAVQPWCQSCHRLYALLEPHRDALAARMADGEKAAYVDFVQHLARAASGQFAAGSA